MAFSYSNYKESDAVKKKRQEAEGYSKYNESDAVRLAREKYNTHNANKVADWTGGTYGQSVKDALDKINNREKFTYDLNGDALYQQYKDQYMNQGKLAMQDTIGQASAMTGGYGNSYAATAGNQAYQGYLQKLNDVVPELYQMALDKYNKEGQDLKDNLAINQSLYGTEYGEYRDRVADWNAERAYLADAYNNERTFDYNKYSSDRDYYNTAYNNERTYDYGQYSDAYNRAFAQYQQNQADYWNQKNYELQSEKADQSAKLAELNYYKANYEIGNGIEPVTRGSRGNTGNGGYKVLGKIYNSREKAEEALAKYLEKMELSDAQINAIYDRLGM